MWKSFEGSIMDIELPFDFKEFLKLLNKGAGADCRGALHLSTSSRSLLTFTKALCVGGGAGGNQLSLPWTAAGAYSGFESDQQE
jgi:hypothetical protein